MPRPARNLLDGPDAGGLSPRAFTPMTDDTPATEISTAPAAAGETPRVRRISNPRPKKSAKAETTERATAPAPAFPRFDEEVPEAAPSAAGAESGSDWPEPETISADSAGAPANPKRKRRRKKGKGGQSQVPPAVEAESAAAPEEVAAPRPSPQPARTKHDAEALAKLACKIYLAEVSEEGVALIGDNDARELSRRCFRLAEIFLDEQARRR